MHLLPILALVAPLACLVGAGASPWSGRRSGTLFWGALVVACSSLTVAAGLSYTEFGPRSLSAALQLCAAATLVFYICGIALLRAATALGYLIFAYCAILSGLALAAQLVGPEHHDAPHSNIDTWLVVHASASVGAYAAVTVAALTAIAILAKQAQLKSKRKSAGWLAAMPSISEAERLEITFLAAAEAMLAIGIASGMAASFDRTGSILAIDHKSVFSIVFFVLVGVVLILHARIGVGGKRAARAALVGYALLSLGYLGVKFVSDILLPG